jgi:hypothetical protein
MGKRKWLIASALCLGLLLGGCRPDSLTLVYRYEPGDVLNYRMEAKAQASWDIAGPGEGSYKVIFDVSESIVSSDTTGAVVDVLMTPVEVVDEGLPSPGPEVRSFRLKIGSRGEVLDILEVEGVPAEALDPDELVFIGGYRPPLPPEPVRILDSWTADQEVDLEALFQQVAMMGRLERVRPQNGSHLAELGYEGEGPLVWTTELPQGAAELTGSVTTTTDATFDVTRGSLTAARSTTIGSFDVQVVPEERRAPLLGTLELELTLRLRRTEPQL